MQIYSFSRILFWASRCLCALTLILISSAIAYSSSHEFYKGKNLRIVVGFPAGGGFDTYARALSRHIGKHIPGNPNVVVDNMPGAGSMIGANHLFKVAKPDGLTLGHFHGGLFLQQLIGRPGIEFDASKFEFIGAPVTDKVACALTKASGITNMESWLAAKSPVKLGATAPGTSGYDASRILEHALKFPIHLVSGYKGTADIRLAAEAGELAGGCWGWDSIKATWAKALQSGEALTVLQIVPKRLPELPSVPAAVEFAKSDEAKKLLDVGVHDQGAFSRPFVLPPGTPDDRVAILRKAFVATMSDEEFLADTKKGKLEIEPVSGEEIDKLVTGRLFKLEPSLLAKLKEILK